jgi:hypothetical protein
MLHKLFGAALLAVSLFLAGCSSSGTAPLTQIDSTLSNQNVQTGIQLACAVVTGAKAGWNAYAAGHKVSTVNQTNADAAIAGVTALCTPPYAANTADAIAKVTAAGVAVMMALSSEQGGATAAAAQ